jgi:hypothetical protein
MEVFSLREQKGSIGGFHSKFDIYDKRFAHIKPILSSISVMPIHSRTTSQHQNDLSSIMERLNTLKVRTRQGPTIDLSLDLQEQVNMLEATIRDQTATIALLENRVVGAGAKMGDLVFQSFEDLLTWVRIKLPSGRFGFVVDGHLFLEFFTLSGHVDSELSAAAEHNAEKAGYATYYEMKVAASFNNLFPLIFGKASAGGMDDSDMLPGVTSGEKWSNGSTGLQHQIMRKIVTSLT